MAYFGKKLSPGVVRGTIKFVATAADARSVTSGDIVYSTTLHPFLCGLCSHAAGFVVSGSEADHTVAYIRELWKPAIHADRIGLLDGVQVTLDADNGIVHEGFLDLPGGVGPEPLRWRPKTAIYLFLGIPRMAEKGARLGADGVGLLRTNLIIQEIGRHPLVCTRESPQLLEDYILGGVAAIAKAFSPKPVWVRTMDFSTADLRHFPDAADEPSETNPMLGWRGLMRELDQDEMLRLEFRAIRRALEAGNTNIGVIFPLVRTVGEYERAKDILAETGLRPHIDLKVGAMFETPSAALEIDAFASAGMDFAFVGINDLTQYTLASDRANPKMFKTYDPSNPAVVRLVTSVLTTCRERGIWTTMSFQGPLLPLLGLFVKAGLNSISVFPDALNTVAGQLVGEDLRA